MLSWHHVGNPLLIVHFSVCSATILTRPFAALTFLSQLPGACYLRDHIFTSIHWSNSSGSCLFLLKWTPHGIGHFSVRTIWCIILQFEEYSSHGCHSNEVHQKRFKVGISFFEIGNHPTPSGHVWSFENHLFNTKGRRSNHFRPNHQNSWQGLYN